MSFFVGLIGCQAPLISPVSAPPSETGLIPLVSFSAREGLYEAQYLARKWAADARLIEVSSPWLERGGYSSEWTYAFYSAQSASQYMIKQGHGLSFALAKPPPTVLALNKDWLDSPQITAFVRLQSFPFPLLSMRLSSSGIWLIETQYQSVAIDAYSGHWLSD